MKVSGTGVGTKLKVLPRTFAHGADVVCRGAAARLHGLTVRSHCTGTVSVHARSPPRRGWSQFDRARRGGCCAALVSLHRDGDAGSTGWPVTLLFLLGSFSPRPAPSISAHEPQDSIVGSSENRPSVILAGEDVRVVSKSEAKVKAAHFPVWSFRDLCSRQTFW